MSRALLDRIEELQLQSDGYRAERDAADHRIEELEAQCDNWRATVEVQRDQINQMNKYVDAAKAEIETIDEVVEVARATLDMRKTLWTEMGQLQGALDRLDKQTGGA